MKRTEEWDFPPTRKPRHGAARQRTAWQGMGPYGHYRYRTSDTYQPKGWDWPIRKKIIDIWWRVMMITIKVILITALTIMAFGASWLIVTVLTL
jgi:hypothetical protein